MVYGDIVGMENALLDAALLLGVARVLDEEVRWARLGLASAIGGAAASVSLLPVVPPEASIPWRVLVPLALVVTAFGGGPRTLQRLFALFVLAFGAGGLALGAARLLGVYALAPLLTLPAMLLVGEFGRRLAVPRSREERVRLRLEMFGRATTCLGLVDSGLRLTDPISSRPVVVVDGRVLRRLMPKDLLAALASADHESLARLLERHPEFVRRLRPLPFMSLGQRDGLIWGFAPDRIVLGEHLESAASVDAVVGVAPHPLSPDDAFQALVPPALAGRHVPRALGDRLVGRKGLIGKERSA